MSDTPTVNDSSTENTVNQLTDNTDINDQTNSDNTTTHNTLQHTIQQWSTLSLDTIRSQLETHVLQIDTESERSTTARKGLAEITKSLKLKSDTDKLASFNAVLKQYQTEINLLTQRAKTTEFEYLKLYKILLDIENPIYWLQQYDTVQQQNQQYKQQVTTLQTQIHDLDAELSTVKDQSITVRNLENDNNTLKQRIEQLESNEHINSQQQTQITELTELYESKLTTLKQQLNEQIKQNNTIQQTLITVQSKLDSKDATQDSSYEAINNELTIANNKILQLQQQLNDNNNNKSNTSVYDNTADKQRTIELENELQRLRTTNTTLSEQYLQTQQKLNTLQQQHTTELQTLQKQLDTVQSQCTQYKSEISKLPSRQQYNELTTQLQLLTELTYTNGQNIDTTQLSQAEKVLLNKSNLLDKELQQLRQQYDDTIKEFNEIKQQHTTLTEQQTQYLQQISQLQYDLNIANTELNSKQHTRNNNTIDTVLNNKTETPTNGTDTDKDSILNVITQQRNRLRTQIQIYEADITKLKHQLERISTECNTYKLDNIKLYEQLQYVKQYNHNGMNKRNTTDTQIDINVENKYKHMHDVQHDPFNEFTKSHRLNKLKSMPTTERITYTVTKFALSRKGTRTFVFIYVVLLHILMFVILYTHTIHNHCGVAEQHTEAEIEAFTQSQQHSHTNS